MEKGEGYFVGAVQRALNIVEFLAQRPGLEASLADIAVGLELPKPTVHRLLANLEAFRLVATGPTPGTYRLGLRLLELGNAVADELQVARVARPHLVHLRDETGETTHLAMLDGENVLYLDRVECDRAVRMVSPVGARLPAHCTALGKAMLAALDDADLAARFKGRKLTRLTDRSATDFADLTARLAHVRQSGYAVDDEEVEPGLRCIGAAVHDRAGAVVAAVSLSAPVDRLPHHRVEDVARQVRRAADAVSAELGWQARSSGRRRLAGS
jgi:DNA-binding IclR family transcriptional regulator